MPSSRHRAASPGWPADVSITTVVPAMAGSVLDGRGQREAVRVRHLNIRQHEREGLSRLAAPRAAPSSASATLGRQRRHHVPAEEHLFEQAPVRGVVVDDEDGQVSQIDRVGNGRDRRGGRPPTAKRAVKWKVLPLPASLSTQRRPPINCTSLDEMVRPSPVPPYVARRRAVRLREGLEDALLTVQRDADAGVADREVQHDVRWGRRPRSSRGARPRPAGVNLMAFPSRLTRIWRRRPGSPLNVCGTAASTSTISSRPFWCALSATAFAVSPMASREVEVDRVELEFARPRSWRSPGCR